MPDDTPTQAQVESQTAAVYDYLYVDGVYDRLGNITAPTLVIAGEQDNVLGFDATVDLFNRCGKQPKLCREGAAVHTGAWPVSSHAPGSPGALHTNCTAGARI